MVEKYRKLGRRKNVKIAFLSFAPSPEQTYLINPHILPSAQFPILLHHLQLSIPNLLLVEFLRGRIDIHHCDVIVIFLLLYEYNFIGVR